MSIKTLFLCGVTIFIHLFSFSQNNEGEITGSILAENGEAILGSYIYVEDGATYASVDTDGNYHLKLPTGTYQLTVTAMGYLEKKQRIKIVAGEIQKINFRLAADPTVLEDVHLIGKSELTQVQESSYNVTTIDTKILHNSSLDLSQALNRAAGVHVRRSGGVGSDADIMLNGFTGKHVKIFLNGIPMEGFSSAFQLNNIPVNLAERIEVYKGVVPISLGSDALGGAINIVTTDQGRNFLDASYSFGSFNTHKSFVNAGYTSDNGFTARFTAYQNYSDNDYKVDADIADLETQQFTGDIREVRRFHDLYRNYTLMGKIGWVNQSFADQLLLGFTYGDEYDEIQHPAYMKIAFGQKYMTSKTMMPNLTYSKHNLFVEDLNVSLTANYNFGKAKSIDDSYRRYNWLGEYIVTDVPGEFNYERQFYEKKNGAVNANIAYTLKNKHTFVVNNVLNTFNRKGRNEVEPNVTDDYPSKTLKDILGMAYKFHPNQRLSATLFSKYYYNKVSKYADPNSTGTYENMTRTTEDLGYGLAISYFLFDHLQLKTSYEKAYRIPTARELFGSGNSFELGNPDLKSESSDNFNLGLGYRWLIAKNHQLNIDASFIYRDIKDFIHQIPNPSNGVLRPGNEAKVENRGVDFSLEYRYANLFMIGTSFSYQNLRIKLKYTSGKDVPSTIYNNRIPNMPYFYGNAHAGVFLKEIWQKKDKLSFNYSLNYTHEFDYSYESYGGIKIPTQFDHNLSMHYSFNDGKYNISLACRNIFDAKLYDNFSLQKPGRSFSIKLRYFIDNL